MPESDGPIRSWREVERFAGKVVIYSAQLPLFTDKGYAIKPENKALMAGYIFRMPWTCKDGNGYGKGYAMGRLVQKNAPPSYCALVNSVIKEEGAIPMREATPEERQLILILVKEGAAHFEHMFDCMEELREALQ